MVSFYFSSTNLLSVESIKFSDEVISDANEMEKNLSRIVIFFRGIGIRCVVLPEVIFIGIPVLEYGIIKCAIISEESPS